MKPSTYRLLVLCLSLTIVIGGGMLLYPVLLESVDPPEATTPVETAPDFTMMDKSEGTWTLSEFLGKPVILNFWSSNCGPCTEEMPHFQKAWETYGDEIHFLMVNLTDGYNDTFRSAMEFLEDSGYTFPVYFDTASEGATLYAIRSMPTTFFLDENGQIVDSQVGMFTEEALEKAIAQLLA